MLEHAVEGQIVASWLCGTSDEIIIISQLQEHGMSFAGQCDMSRNQLVAIAPYNMRLRM